MAWQAWVLDLAVCRAAEQFARGVVQIHEHVESDRGLSFCKKPLPRLLGKGFTARFPALLSVRAFACFCRLICAECNTPVMLGDQKKP